MKNRPNHQKAIGGSDGNLYKRKQQQASTHALAFGIVITGKHSFFFLFTADLVSNNNILWKVKKNI